MPSWIRLAEIAFVAFLATIIFISWREDRRDRSQLAAELAAAHQALAAADARQHDRDAQLQQSLTAIAQDKRTVQSPSQILADLPHQLPLPTPLTLSEATTLPDTPLPKAGASGSGASSVAKSGSSQPSQNSQVVIPPEDLKPLYDFTLDCKACQAKLATAQGDLADERTKSATLSKERDAALQVARGGTLWRRVTRAAKWFTIGAAAGAIAAKTAHR
jgi:type II secretory pathway pseudopilin PulG